MTLSDRDLSQMDTDYLDDLPEGELRPLSKQLLADLKEARERLKQSPDTSSRPPSSREPWQSNQSSAEPSEEAPATDDLSALDSSESSSDDLPSQDSATPPAATGDSGKPKKAGRQVGSPGYSRNLTLPVTRTIEHRPDCCAACRQSFADNTDYRPWNARFELELEIGNAESPKLQIEHSRHDYFSATCPCGHQTRAEPGRGADEDGWSVALSEWHLCGPRLVSFLVYLSLSLRASRSRIQAYLRDWLGIYLSTSTINQCIHEAGRAVAPVVDEQLIAELKAAGLLHIDETPWKEAGQLFWLWVFVSAQTVIYQVGKRHRLVVNQLLGEAFCGLLMTDGYSVYRIFPRRLRCWAHLVRKARALYQCLDSEGQAFGEALLLAMILLMRNIHRLRESPPDAESLWAQNQQLLTLLRSLCETHRDIAHVDSRQLAGEFLNDWEAIVRVVETPAHPLTNNVAERSLRHWVLLRKITFGSRTAQGSRVVALLASVIDTARLRDLNPWEFIAQTLAERRKNQPVPRLPMPVLA
ncbi:IS66 family transposase [Methylotuvimicrobium buryatense]|nr:IS66 family transposase [Methylotuvimicrobium buryatense]